VVLLEKDIEKVELIEQERGESMKKIYEEKKRL
jgi:hypothetical protein